MGSLIVHSISLFRFAVLKVFATLLTIVLVPHAAVCAAISRPPDRPYVLGRGMTRENSGVTIGGYASLQYEEGGPRPHRFAVSTLSTLTSWEISSHIQFMAELEFEDLAVIDNRRGFHSRNDPFEVERLYADFMFSDAFTVRVGKFLTPIGRWNENHAAPLVWTTSRPAITLRPFSGNTTGGMVYGLVVPFGYDLEYAAYAAFPDKLDPDKEEGALEFEEEVGFRVRYRLGDFALGTSYTNFLKERAFEENRVETERQARENLLGLDFFWSRNRYELSGEFLYGFSEKGVDNTEWGLFFQGVIPLTRDLSGVGRYEYFDPGGSLPGAHLWTMGMAFRPLHALVLKAEYSVARDNLAEVPEGFATSIAVLF